MNDAQSLQGLCTVCYAEQPKYRCPRCKTQTCSLPCYKRHQQRASCNGQRNPAAFVKKSQWATPNGIDHDFNYLKSVERNIERADEDIQALAGDSVKQNSRQWHVDSVLQHYLQRNNINVVRAPKGMSRSRQNRTRVTQSGKVFWTVEWVDDEGTIIIDENCPESSKLVTLSASVMARRHKSRALLRTMDEPEPKRRRVEEVAGVDQHAQVSKTTETHSKQTELVSLEEHSRIASSKESAAHLYLLRPGNADAKVLIPLQPQHTLTEALQKQTVQEYPTIYSLSFDKDELPARYILEETFLATSKARSSSSKLDTTSSHVADKSNRTQAPDAAKILDMLRRDVHNT